MKLTEGLLDKLFKGIENSIEKARKSSNDKILNDPKFQRRLIKLARDTTALEKASRKK